MASTSSAANADATLLFTAAGCNPTTTAADSSSSSSISSDSVSESFFAYGAGPNVAVCTTPLLNIRWTLRGHQRRVNVVRFSPSGQLLVSGDSNGGLRVWQHTPHTDTQTSPWVCLAHTLAHQGGVTALAVQDSTSRPAVAAREHGASLLVCSTGVDGSLRLWSLHETTAAEPSQPASSPDGSAPTGQANESTAAAAAVAPEVTYSHSWSERTSLPMNTGAVPECLAVAMLPGTQIPVIASGSVNFQLSLYLFYREMLIRVASLEGHSDWVRCVDFCRDGDRLLLASGSKDNYVRIWTLQEVLGASEESVPSASSRDAASEADAVSVRTHRIKVGGRIFSAEIESVLSGHQDWVSTVRWYQAAGQGPSTGSGPFLLTSSSDRSAQVWCQEIEDDQDRGEAEQAAAPSGVAVGKSEVASATSALSLAAREAKRRAGLWVSKLCVGELGGSARRGGLMGAVFAMHTRTLIAHAHNGALHCWEAQPRDGGDPEGKTTASVGLADLDHTAWVPRSIASGHTAAVKDLAWHPSGAFVVTVSLDQSARLFACVEKSSSRWLELARPQVHGYDLVCCAFCSSTNQRQFYVSGGAEKVLRAFQPPDAFWNSLSQMAPSNTWVQDHLDHKFQPGDNVHAVAAQVPALGLSNKPVYVGASPAAVGEGATDELKDAKDALTPSFLIEETSSDLAARMLVLGPPSELVLQSDTLWPEAHKLYGHGNELKCVCISHDGRYIASAASAARAEDANILLWDAHNFHLLGSVAVHRLTVTRLCFSHDDRFLLSVSRDRQLGVLVRCSDASASATTPEDEDAAAASTNGSDTSPYRLLLKSKVHDRVVWDCAFSSDDGLVATGSRDQRLRLWSFDADAASKLASLESPTALQRKSCVVLKSSAVAGFKSGVTALSWHDRSALEQLLAVGLESGELLVLRVLRAAQTTTAARPAISLHCRVAPHLCPDDSVLRLSWRPDPRASIEVSDKTSDTTTTTNTATITLAVASADHSTRIYSIDC